MTGEELKAIRKRLGLSQVQISVRLKLPRSSWIRMEKAHEVHRGEILRMALRELYRELNQSLAKSAEPPVPELRYEGVPKIA